MSFIRRFSTFPSSQVISQIEGIVIVDLPPPSTIEGVNTGVVGVVGEFADMKYAVSVDGSGNVSTKCQPVEVTSAQDMINKVGGWDETLGDFGGDDGNGFVAVNPKRFSRLVLAPLNLASSKGVRLWRELPTNKSGVDASPIVPMQAVSIAAGTEFKSGNNRVRLATSAGFTAAGPIATGTDGEEVASGPAATAQFTSASANFVTAGVKAGDALVLGVLGTAGCEPGTYRIVSVVDANTLTVEKQDGTDLTFQAATDLPWRVHPAATCDTGAAYAYSSNAAYLLPARTLDAAVSPGAVLAPTVAAEAGTANAWNALSGLKMGAMPGLGNGLSHNANTQPANKTTTSALEALYAAAFDVMLADSSPIRDVSVIMSARTSATIRSALKQHVLSASATGKGRVAVISPAISEVNETTVLGSTGVGATRDERVIYCWPGVKTSVRQAAEYNIKRADGTYTNDGILDVRADGFMASILSNLAAERNPGQATDPVPLCLSPVLGFQSGNLPAFSMTDYILFRQNGVAAIRFDRTAGTVFQSGITSSLVSGQKNINRRRMADEIQDSLAAAYEKFSKLPLTQSLKDAIDSETVAYLSGLVSLNNPAAQRIEAFSVDSKSGNTPELSAQGIHVVIVRVKMLATADDIVLQAEVGPTVNISTT